jgi:hypothetical protein
MYRLFSYSKKTLTLVLVFLQISSTEIFIASTKAKDLAVYFAEELTVYIHSAG